MWRNKYRQQISCLQKELEQAEEMITNVRQERFIIEEQRNGLVHERDELKNELKHRIGELASEKEQYLLRNKELEKAIKEKQEYINYLEFDRDMMSELHEDAVMKNWKKPAFLENLVCLNPFTYMEILTDGEVFACCSGHIKSHFSAGNLFKQDWEEIWNSENVKKLRYSVSRGTFEYCSRFCPYLHGKPQHWDVPFSIFHPLRYRDESHYTYKNYEECELGHGPLNLVICCDPTCNLYCTSCRNSIKGLSREESDRIYDVLINKAAPMLPGCRYITLTGSGEVFASSAVIRFLKTFSKEKYPDLQVCLCTNGQLLTEEKWQEFSNLHDMDIHFYVSIDAAEKQTYEEIRRGGRWEVLLENLAFISRLVQEKSNYSLGMNFVIQEKNYKQIEAFIEMGRKYHASRIHFNELRNWGTYSAEEYLANDVLNPRHPQRESALKILRKAAENEDVVIGGHIIDDNKSGY